MQIFNKTTVVGLFSDDQEVEKAVTEIQKHKLDHGDDNSLQIVDENRLPQEMPAQVLGRKEVIEPPNTGATAGGPGVLYTSPDTASAREGNIERGAYQLLTDMGVGKEEASFYARNVARGNKLVILETGEKEASQAADIMNQAGAKTLET